MRWLGNSDIIRQIHAADPAALPAAYSLAAPVQIPDPQPVAAAVAVARYRSLADLQKDVPAFIDARYRWVLYDPENWPDTPPEEQADPWTWLPRFGQYAHANGYRVICAPARDLGNVAGSVSPKGPGEDLNSWYLVTAVAASAASHADIVSIQSQALTEDLAAYREFTGRAARQAKLVNPYVKVFAGVSTAHGTAVQMAAAARSVHVDGFWLNVPGPDPDIGKACEWLRLMTAGEGSTGT